MFSFSLINEPNAFVISEDRIREILEYVEKNVPIAQNGILNVAFLSDEEIRVLNRDYRSIDKTTDVLSFHYHADFSELSAGDTAGECIFSEAKILAQAEEHGHSHEEEFLVLFIHSVLHILGFDHESDEDFADMWTYEKDARAFFGLASREE